MLTLFDFLTGLLLANATAHLVLGLFNIRFLSVFGFSSTGNIAYAVLNVAFALSLFHFEHGLRVLTQNGIVVGALTTSLLFLILGRAVRRRFRQNAEE